jgi:acyl carrier protein
MQPEEIVAKVFSVPLTEVTDNTSNHTVAAWDSFGHISLILELEAAYTVALSPQDALVMTDVSSIKKVLKIYGAAW